jgi:signal transduction histidine kinase/CHASE2 domain-containing sensor protein
MLQTETNKLDKLATSASPLWRAGHWLPHALIILAATSAALLVTWRAPGLELYARDWLMHWRGPLPPAEELLIVAIDERSLARFGRFPWPRSLMAEALNKLGEVQPKAIALDVLYSEATNEAEDRALAAAVARAGKVIVAAQLTEAYNEAQEPQAVWLRPLPELARAAAGIGHVNVASGFDGVARALNLRMADDEAQAFWAMAVETVRVGDGLSPETMREMPDAVRLGPRVLPLNVDARNLVISGATGETVQAMRLLLDYVGPPGSYAAQTISFADVLDGGVAMERLRGKYVLIGATAATLGDRLAAPFTRTDGAQGRQHGEWMPGVEILANTMQTILRARYYRETPDWLAVLGAMLTASAVLLLLSLTQGRREVLKQIAALAGLLAVLVFGSYLAFAHWLLLPPLLPLLTAYAVATPLALLRRSLAMSAALDARIAEWGTGSNDPLALTLPSQPVPNPLALIAQLTEATSVSLFAGNEKAAHLVAQHSASPVLLPALLPAPLNDRNNELTIPLNAHGKLVLTGAQPPANELLLLCRTLAKGYLTALKQQAREAATTKRRHWLPRGGEWKAQALGLLQRQQTARSRFVERALRSVEDGLLIAAADGRIVFANPRAAQILGASEHALTGSDLFVRLAEAAGKMNAFDQRQQPRDVLVRLLVEGMPVERELCIGARHYILRLSALLDETGLPGFVAALAEITQQRALQQTQNEVMALVTHEMKTPLTAIQGISEVLAQYEVEAERRRELHLAINDEAKRLARMIDEYLDLTRLESGARPLRCTPLAIGPLLERALLLLEPVAAQSGIRLVRRLPPGLPLLNADADLLARAVTNLVANALKFSPPQREVLVEVRADNEDLLLEVTDQGSGIPAAALPHVFEKFYRVPRAPSAGQTAEDAAPGTGLGLAFVRECAEQHGGRVTVTSEEGVGSTFTLWLPLNVAGREQDEGTHFPFII